MYKIFLYIVFILFFTACSVTNKIDLGKEAPMTLKEDRALENLVCPPPKIKVVEKTIVRIKEVPIKEESKKLQTKQETKVTIGEVEYVFIPSLDIRLKARIDTGAKTSSIHAVEIKEFERDGEKWVKFKILDNNKNLIQKALPLHRIVHIKQESDTKSDRRYVVNMKLKLGDLEQLVEVSLNDRSHLNYPVLIGRNFLRGLFVVDVSKKFLLKQ
eukprot:Anaeramoba_ignava/a482742_7.p1 GENE.a482742_7~~a482742_7.p1  ORF type:complete len:214 (+),score=9.91 a482742_7:59-700(+)